MPERSGSRPAGRFRKQAGDKSWNSKEQESSKTDKPSSVSYSRKVNCLPSGRFGRHTSFRSSISGLASPFLNISPNLQKSSAKNYTSWWKSPVVHVHGKDSCQIMGSYDKHRNQRLESGGKDSATKRCNWISHGTDPVYVAFHDNQWGVPIYDEHLLLEMLLLSGMLSEYTWTEILTNREAYRDIFSGYDANIISEMDAKRVSSMATVKKAMLSESRIRCIINNSKCVLKIEEEYRSFSTYIWRFVNYTPIINAYKYPRNIPLRTSKSMAISNDLVRRGFKFVGPTIIYTFMQAAGMTVDHLVDCFRYEECVKLAESPWGLLHMHFNF